MELVDLLDLDSSARQVLVSRARYSGVVAGLAKHVLWTYLWPLSHRLVSDAEQTEKGQEFWGM